MSHIYISNLSHLQELPSKLSRKLVPGYEERVKQDKTVRKSVGPIQYDDSRAGKPSTLLKVFIFRYM
jgi:hypothetical protein